MNRLACQNIEKRYTWRMIAIAEEVVIVAMLWEMVIVWTVLKVMVNKLMDSDSVIGADLPAIQDEQHSSEKAA